MNTPLISLCIPTNGIAEWVFPVLESIYTQAVDPAQFEVIVTDNGDNEVFQERMTEYSKEHENLKYRKTEAVLFHNQLEALKLAQGHYLKFINHRYALKDGTLKRMISLVQENLEQKPIIYMSNGMLKSSHICETFDGFVRNLGRYVSWTTGVGIWKSDYDNLPADIRIDPISPHSCILFAVRSGRTFIIDNEVYFREVDTDQTRKGKYDIFKAFAVEELAITQNLYINGDITADTFKAVKADYGKMVADLYLTYRVLKWPCSYQLDGFSDAMGIYFSKWGTIARAWLLIPQKAVQKGLRLLRREKEK